MLLFFQIDIFVTRIYYLNQFGFIGHQFLYTNIILSFNKFLQVFFLF